MPGKASIFSKLFCTAVFVFLEIAAVGIIRRGGAFQNMWVVSVAREFNAAIWKGTTNIRHFASLGRENRELANENFLLRNKLREYGLELSADETARGWKTSGNFRYMSAQVVKVGLNRQHNFLIVDRGENDGVKSGDGVVTPMGVVGIVQTVSPDYCYVMSLANNGMVISSRLGRSGSVGPLSWNGLGKRDALLKEIPLHVEFEPGDTVYTSGFSSIFPPDIPVGTAGKSVVVNGASHEIQITLFEDLSSLRYVTIVDNTGEEQINRLSDQ